MRTITKNVYTFDELSEDAKKKAIEAYKINADYPWNKENRDSLEAFCKLFNVKASDWSYGGYSTPYIILKDFYLDEDLEWRGEDLKQYLLDNYKNDLWKPKYLGQDENKNPIYSKTEKENSCVFTGYCIDDDILKPIYYFIEKPNDTSSLEDLMQNCLNSWVNSAHDDYEAYFSDESMVDEIKANEREFYESGEML